MIPRIEGFGRLGQSAAPDLPVRFERVAVNPDSVLELIEIEIDWSEGVIPGPLAAFPGEDPAAPPIDASHWERQGFWPRQPVQIAVRQGRFRTLHFSSLEIRPLQVDLTTGRFRVARRLKLLVDRGSGAWRLSAGRTDPLVTRAGEEAALGAEGVGQAWPPPQPTTEALGPSTTANFPAWYFDVKQTGLYRISYSWAQANAPDLLAFLTGNDTSLYRLSCQGLDLPLWVEGGDDGVFDPPGTGRPEGDALIFYGQSPAGYDLFDPTVWQSGDIAPSNVYRLDLLSGAPRLVGRDAAPVSGYAVTPSFRATTRHEEDVRFQGFVPHDGVDHWYADPYLIANPDPVDMNQLVQTPAHAGGEVSIRVRLMGFDYQDNFHRSRISIDGTQVDEADWDGHIEFTHGVDNGTVLYTPPSPLGEVTTVNVALPLTRQVNGSSITKDIVAVNWVEIDYDRLFDARDDVLFFDVAGDGSQEIQISSFSAPPEIWELTDTTLSTAGMSLAEPRRLTGVDFSGGVATFELRTDAAAPTRRFVAVGPNGFLVPDTVREDSPADSLDGSLMPSLKDPANGADWLVIGPASLLDTGTPGSELNALISHRQNQGLTTAIVDIQDVYDEFSYGITDPQAIRDFIRETLTTWQGKPTYVLLVGDATRDYKNRYGHSVSRQFVPTMMYDIAANTQFGYYLSDTILAMVLGEDELPDVMLGRIPSHTLTEAEAVFRKILRYEQGNHSPTWTGRACLVSERDEPELFRVHDEIYDQWFQGAGPQTAQKLYETILDEDCNSGGATPQNDRIDQCINDGAAILSYAGHGGYRTWGKTCSIWETKLGAGDDIEDLVNADKLVFTVQANCITGHFSQDSSVTAGESDTWFTLAEDWLATAEVGAVAGMAPSHLTRNFQLDAILDPIYERIYGKRKERLLGELDMHLRRSFDTEGDWLLNRSFVFVGDPATTLAVPAPGQPTILSIDKAGSRELQISWTSVADAATYRVYRAESPGGPYVLAGDGLTATHFLDTGLINCKTYYYYVVAVDDAGFESRWSNFNETCYDATPEPAECRSGVPENPLPPSKPILLSVTDTQKGGQLEVSWQAVPDDDVIRYRVLWRRDGETNYSGEKTTPETRTSVVIGGLEDNRLYWVAVRAEHCSAVGPESDELSGTPHLVRGINPPQSIGDLRLRKTGADLLLEWTIPGQTVWGVTLGGVSAVKIYGSETTPAFRTDAAHLLVDLPGEATSWSHTGEAGSTVNNRYYLLRVADASGELSAGGQELPGPVSDLRVSRNGAGGLLLRWSPLRETMGEVGRTPSRAEISSYDLYGRASVLPRTECGAANRLVEGIPQATTEVSVTVSEPPDDLYTYQVLGVDTHGSESVW
ncbi:MAG: C25 family cysteine peptidase [Acidobacteriota bacterium]|nr:C25 family cysteine peptidase [Acidobacteriota bacterium]